MGAPASVLKRPSMAAVVTGWCAAMNLPCRSPVGKICTTQAATPTTTATRRKARASSRKRPSSR